MTWHDYSGIIHLHSSYSFDGRTPVPDILSAARANGIDFLMLTDHQTLQARQDGYEGWHGDTLLIVGQEISPRFNHYLAFGLQVPIVIPEDETSISPQTYIEAVRTQGGLGFIAHPDHQGANLFHVKHYPWLDWTVTGYNGFGIWDFMTDWQSSLKNIPTALYSYLFPALALRGPRQVTLERWDRLNQEGRVIGIGELDNHNTLRKLFGLRFFIFPFQRAFRFLRTHLLTEEPLTGDGEKDILTLLSALEQGKAYVAQEYFQRAKGFTYTMSDEKQVVTMGDDLLPNGSVTATVETPRTGKIRIIRNGKLYHEAVSRRIDRPIDHDGLYRIEVYLRVLGKYRPWIFSNPIYVGKRT
jgi:hypothetical protein